MGGNGRSDRPTQGVTLENLQFNVRVRRALKLKFFFFPNEVESRGRTA